MIRPLSAPAVSLARASELEQADFRAFMDKVNRFASTCDMRTYQNWSKVWEYPWLWLHGIQSLPWWKLNVLDLGSELSPMPWFLASLGARVRLIEVDPAYVARWSAWRDRLKVDVDWHIVGSEILPLPDSWADLVTSFSVIEHQTNKAAAIQEVIRVLKPGGTLAISFDICEPDMGMTFPEWNGAALTMNDFEKWIWNHPAFGNNRAPAWNVDDIPDFLGWHRQSAPHHNYVVGAAVLRKGGTPDQLPPASASRVSDRIFWCNYDDPANIGDNTCNPIDYADLPGTRADLRQPFGDVEAAALIFGGGGILHSSTVQQIGAMAANARCLNPHTALVAWGMGANELGERAFRYPDYLGEFDLVGLRDYGNPWTYVPCPSCLHPAFDVPPAAPTHEFVVYEHYDEPINGLPVAPKLWNRGNRWRTDEVIRFLAQGEFVVTNSYHGVYWSLLLGRKVIVFRPFANRFFGFSRPLEFCDETDWQEKAHRASVYDDYLEECRSLNRQFRDKVGDLLGTALVVCVRPQASLRVQHLISIRDALESFHQAEGRYPCTEGWDGIHSNWGRSAADWIPGLVPRFLPELPRDPRPGSDPSQQYLYRSDGTDFKLIAHAPDDFVSVTTEHPDFADPTRPGGAYGLWSAGAAAW
jgi:SAM-dependent methyltransferase